MQKLSAYSIINCRPEAVRLALRSQIISGELAPGEKLPSTDKLAKLYKVSKDTISKAMNMLADEKLIIRRRGAGTFAAPDIYIQPEANCRNIGIYLPMLKSDNDQLNPQISPTTFQLFNGALSALENTGYVLTAIAPGDTPLSERLRYFQLAGLLLPNREDCLEDVISHRLPETLPCLVMGKPKNVTSFNYVEELSDKTVETLFSFLIKMKFRRFGIFSSSELDFQHTSIFRGYRNAAIQAGCYNIRSEKPLSEKARQEEYDTALNELLNMPSPPEVLVVFRNRFLPGVLQALRKKSLRVPEDISLVLIENAQETPPVYHGMNISSFLLISKREYGQTAGEKLLALIRKREQKVQYDIPWKFHPGSTLRKKETN